MVITDLPRASWRIDGFAACLAAAAVASAVVGWIAGWPLGVDSAVYRAGASAILHGEPLYGPLAALPPWEPRLPFAYPPFAALVFLPLAALPAALAWGALAATSLLALSFVVRTVHAGRIPPAVTLGAVLLLEPIWRTLSLGQVNILLMSLVVLDVLRPSGARTGGIAIGLAAAVKLTPLVFLGHLVLTGRSREAGRALLTFLLAQVVAAVILPADAARYWGGALLGANDATGNGWFGNQSLSGVVQRLSHGAGWAPVLTLVLCLACGGLAAWLVRTLRRREIPVGALLVTASCGLLISPISWNHHWVWVAPATALLLARAGAGSIRARYALLGVAAVFTGWELAVVPGGHDAEMSWTWRQQLVGNGYAWGGIAALGIAWRAVAVERRHSRARTAVNTFSALTGEGIHDLTGPGTLAVDELAAQQRLVRDESACPGMRPSLTTIVRALRKVLATAVPAVQSAGRRQRSPDGSAPVHERSSGDPHCCERYSYGRHRTSSRSCIDNAEGDRGLLVRSLLPVHLGHITVAAGGFQGSADRGALARDEPVGAQRRSRRRPRR